MAQTLQGRLVIPPPATPPRGPGSDRQPVNCAACLGTDIELRQIRCGCHYCRPCMHQMFLFSIRNRVWWPPKCHNSSASEDDVVWTGDDDLLKMFREVAYEMSIDNPLYCWQPRCSALLDLNAPRVHDGTNAVACPKCHALTCINCKREHHPDKPTCEDPGLDPGLQVIANESQWRRCRCGRIISQIEGCNHIRCICGREFCYICGLDWKTCECLARRAGHIERPQLTNMQMGSQPLRDLPVQVPSLPYRRGPLQHRSPTWTPGPPPPGTAQRVENVRPRPIRPQRPPPPPRREHDNRVNVAHLLRGPGRITVLALGETRTYLWRRGRRGHLGRSRGA